MMRLSGGLSPYPLSKTMVNSQRKAPLFAANSAADSMNLEQCHRQRIEVEKRLVEQVKQALEAKLNDAGAKLLTILHLGILDGKGPMLVVNAPNANDKARVYALFASGINQRVDLSPALSADDITLAQELMTRWEGNALRESFLPGQISVGHLNGVEIAVWDSTVSVRRQSSDKKPLQ